MAAVRYHKPEVVGQFAVNLNGYSVEYTLKRSSRARLVRLVIQRDSSLTVTVPKRYNIRNLHVILEKKAKWIIEKYQEHRNTATAPTKKEFNTGDAIPYLGKSLKLIIQGNFEGTSFVKRNQNILMLNVNSKKHSVNSSLELWYRMEASEIIRSKTEKLSEQTGIIFNWLGIRGQRTRWGSCSRKGNLSFNWKLIMAPDAVINYVIIHELAHIKEMNHSHKFWDLVALHCPHFRQHRKWLREHDAKLNTSLVF